MSARQHHPLPPPPRAARRLACVRAALQQPPAEVAAAGAGAESTDEQLVPRGHRLTVSEMGTRNPSQQQGQVERIF